MDRAEYWLKRINKMIDSGRYKHAEDFLFSVGEYIENKAKITDNQINAIKKISND